MKENKLVILTGATSYLGRNLAKFFIMNKIDVVGLVRSESKNISYIENLKGLDIVEYNMSTKINPMNIPENILYLKDKYDGREIYVYHLAWDSGSKEGRYEEKKQISNFENSKNIIELATLMDAKRLIFTSSQAEDNLTPYGIYKKKFAEYGKENFPHFIHTRIFSVYGGDDEKKTLINYIKSCIKNNEVATLGLCNHIWNYLHIDDFCNIMSLFINDDIDENLIYDIASDDTKKLREYVDSIEGLKKEYIDRGVLDEPFSIPDITNILKILPKGYKFKEFSIL